MEHIIKADHRTTVSCLILQHVVSSRKSTQHSHYTSRRSHSAQSLFEPQSHFKRRNKARSLASLWQSQQLQPPNEEAEPWGGALVYNTVDENTYSMDLFH